MTRPTVRGAVLLGVLVGLLGAALPGSATGAYLTDSRAAAASDAGTGSWCALPDHSTHPNVYRLADLPTFASALDGFTTRMIVVPVVQPVGDRAQDFAPLVQGSSSTTSALTLGVRLWACSATFPAGSQLKITAWRRDAGSSPDTAWLTPVSATWAGQRLDPQQGWGLEVQRLHRWGTRPPGEYTTNVRGVHRQQYSWVLSSNRRATALTAKPYCGSLECTLELKSTYDWQYTFAADDGTSTTSAPPPNSVTYLAAKYWTGAGDWPTTTVAASPTVLEPYAADTPLPLSSTGYPDSTDGRQVQWVVMEWWGSATPTPDLRVEVFLQ